MVEFIEYVIQVVPKFMKYLPLTLEMALAAFLCGALIGLFLLWLEIGPGRRGGPARLFAVGYGIALRSVPSIILLFLIFYGPQSLFPKLGWGRLPKPVFAVITFSLIYSAYFAQVFRGAYGSIDKGQLEAALSMGLTHAQGILRIVGPQAFIVALPNLGSMMVLIVSETSLAYLIGVRDLMGEVTTLNARSYNVKTVELYFVVTMIYWGANAVIERFFGFAERKLRQGRGNAP
ncbi:MAG: amino acid ABC transporter permease [Deltaproteobacteria bacterium]|jgi:L-cystine transport system permease protein|nr:amino acid ABC transporter permease [Deltaproteobacteria bacterium]